MSKKSNVQRTLDFLREKFPDADIAFTEKLIPRTYKKKDLYGIIDLLVLVQDFSVTEPAFYLYGIQVCGGNDYAAHMKKMLASDKAYKWVYSSGRGCGRGLLLIGWRELKQGWRPRVHRFSRGDWKSMPPPLTSKYSTPKVDRL